MKFFRFSLRTLFYAVTLAVAVMLFYNDRTHGVESRPLSDGRPLASLAN